MTDTVFSVAGTYDYEFNTFAEAALLSLYVTSTSGDVTVTILTKGKDNHTTQVSAFPTVSSATSDILLRKAASILSRVIVRVTCTAACELTIRARGVSAAESSVKITGASALEISQKTIGTTTEALLPESLDEREGILIYNNNVSGSEILYIAETAAKVTTGVEILPVYPGGSLSLDLAGGQTIYARADIGSIDVKIMEVGG